MTNYELDAEDSEWNAFWLNDNHLIIKEDDENDLENDSQEPQKEDSDNELR